MLWLGGQCSYIKCTERFMKQFLIIAARHQALVYIAEAKSKLHKQELTYLVPDYWH